MYEGKMVRLRAVCVEDAETFLPWMNDLQTARQLRGGMQIPYTLTAERAWAENAGTSRTDAFDFAVETLDGQLLGACSCMHVDWHNRKCVVGWQIGDPDMRGKGYGTDMIGVLLRFCFAEMGLQKVSLRVYEFNKDAVRLYERLGFQREGVLRRETFTDNRWWDEFIYSMFQEEWQRALQ